MQERGPSSDKEFRRMLEETKKEVREIKAVEAQMRWNMTREEKKGKILEEKAVTSEIRDWRWRQSDEMKALVEQKAHETKALELQDSKEYQGFKREHKVLIKDEECKTIQEVYLQDMENAAWRAENAKEAALREKELNDDRFEDVQSLRETRNSLRLQEKVEADENRTQDQQLEMTNLARELAREKDALLQSLEYTRACQRAPVRSGGARHLGRSLH